MFFTGFGVGLFENITFSILSVLEDESYTACIQSYT